jgi:hypothetical protein
MKASWGIVASMAVAVCIASVASAQDKEAVKERVAAIKQSLAESKAALKTYEWTETTTFSMKGEVKSHVQNRCHYGPDGKVVKTMIGAPPEQKKKGGLRGKIVENKKEDIANAMKEAKALIASYVPPDPAKLQASFAAGKASVSPLDPGKVTRVTFKDYNKPGDMLSIDVDLAQNRLMKLNIASYAAKPDDHVTLEANLGTLEGGITYPAQITLDVKAANAKTVIVNSDYKKTGA